MPRKLGWDLYVCACGCFVGVTVKCYFVALSENPGEEEGLAGLF